MSVFGDGICLVYIRQFGRLWDLRHISFLGGHFLRYFSQRIDLKKEKKEMKTKNNETQILGDFPRGHFEHHHQAVLARFAGAFGSQNGMQNQFVFDKTNDPRIGHFI